MSGRGAGDEGAGESGLAALVPASHDLNYPSSYAELGAMTPSARGTELFSSLPRIDLSERIVPDSTHDDSGKSRDDPEILACPEQIRRHAYVRHGTDAAREIERDPTADETQAAQAPITIG